MASAKTGRLAGHRIVITGAPSGIGQGAAHLLLSVGTKLALFDLDTRMGNPFLSNTANYAPKRCAVPSEIVNAILFQVSGEASFVTGAALATDDGRSFQ